MRNPTVRRIGVLGGTFDPVHLGHLLAAQDAWEAGQLDRVVFMPAAQAPLKDRAPGVSAEQRLALLRAAIAGDERFEVSTFEISRGGVSYTIETARELHRASPHDRLFWIIGADQALQLALWREIDALARIVEFIVLARPGFAGAPAHAPAHVRLHAVAAHVCEISSSEVRARIAAGRSIRYLVPPAAAELIERERLYR